MFQCIIQHRNGLIYNAPELKHVFPDIRVQLNDQLKNLDGRLEIQQGIVSEFHGIFRRRAEIEANYSKELDKLAKLITNRHKEHKQRRDGWQLFSSVQLWEQMVNHIKKSSRDHAALSDIYTCHIVQRCNQINEDLQRIYKKVRTIISISLTSIMTSYVVNK
jgi:SLIT-ROBO Rho GTPase activating protein